jgi:L-lactate dehydrogenase complex protein LldF
LGVFLRLLARSATGQPITAYSSHFHGPRPGCELHIVLVDNGRTKILASEDFRRSLTCIRCGACLNTCPVYRRSGGHSYGVTVAGPIGSIVNTVRNFDEHKSLPFACSLCGSCTDVCPVKIDLHQQLFVMRRHLAERKLVSSTKRLSAKVAAVVLQHPRLYGMFGRVARAVLRNVPRGLIYNRWNPWGRQRELPAAPKDSFRKLYRKRQSGDGSDARTAPDRH